MKSHFGIAYLSLTVVTLVMGQDFNCPETNGIFADSEQCDLYYVCEKGVVMTKLCPDGMLFDDSIRNREKCVLPHNVDCGDREFVQEPTVGIDPACKRAYGIFDHSDPSICDKFITCSNGTAHELPCTHPLVFDNAIGTCVRKENRSPEAKTCEDFPSTLVTIEGFTCPGKEQFIGPHNLIQQHPIYPHPSDCQFFFTCYFGKDPNKFGCPHGQVFDALSLVCKEPAEVAECACWYGCGKDSSCPDDECNPDCSCTTK